MRSLVTGAAGFIGSHLCECLLESGHSVVGVDRFSDYYDRATKERQISPALDLGLDLIEFDLANDSLEDHLDGVDVVFHLAAQPGIRASWGNEFGTYVDDNILATQRLLEACTSHSRLKVVYASSSSVYGDQKVYPTTESAPLHPFSPYGMTKLAAENLCALYARNFGVNTIALRYFTVYGPRQRPDMAFTRLIRSAMYGLDFPLYGDGRQLRQFTFVGDIVRANILAASSVTAPGEVLNICGGAEVALSSAVDAVAELVGRAPKLVRHDAKPGDVSRTGGDGSRAQEVIGWKPDIDLREGLAAQVDWARRELDPLR